MSEKAPTLHGLFVPRMALYVLICLFMFAGSIASVETGLTWDEQQEQGAFGVIGGAVKELAHGDAREIEHLQSYGDKYYGIGFRAIAYPIQLLLRPSIERSFGLDSESSLLLAKHPAVFLMFCISVVAFYRLLRLLIPEPTAAIIFTLAFAMYPYLFGHAMFNVKDIPYMSVYLLCTYLSVRMVQHHLAGKKASFTSDFVALLFATAFLASIRIPGLAILLQYSVTFAVADRTARQMPTSSAPLLQLKTALAFLLLLLGLVIAAYPALWWHPFDGILHALDQFRRYPWVGCTLTWGECMAAQDLPATYVLGWLLVKLPILALLGLVLTPFVLKRVAAEPLRRVAVLTLLFGSLYPLVVAILLRIVLYDETRHLLFVYPLLFLLGSIALYALSRRLARIAAMLSLAMFAWDQIQLHPYQYVYFNEAARFLNVDQLFETDYWGASGRELGRMVTANAKSTEEFGCVFADPLHLFRPFIDRAVCAKSLDLLETQSPPRKDFLIAIFTRRTHWPSRFEVPPNCTQVAEVARTFPLSKHKVTMAVAYRCLPSNI